MDFFLLLVFGAAIALGLSGGDESDGAASVVDPDNDGNDATALATGGDDIVNLGAGADILNAGRGDDAVYGGKGGDTLRGGDGADDLYGDGGIDLLDGGNGADNLYGGAWHDGVFGGAGDDDLYGGAGKDILNGGVGDDNLYGGAWDDHLFGGEGTDLIYGGNGNDFILASDVDPAIGAAAFEVARSGDNPRLEDADVAQFNAAFGDPSNPSLSSDTVFGGDGSDFITMSAGDVVEGGQDGDTFYLEVDFMGDGPIAQVLDFNPAQGDELVFLSYGDEQVSVEFVEYGKAVITRDSDELAQIIGNFTFTQLDEGYRYETQVRPVI